MIFLNNRPINITTFPDRTTQVWKLDNIQSRSYNRIDWFYNNPGELLDLIQLIDLVNISSDLKSICHIPYLPYARQDKPRSNIETFAGRSIWHISDTLQTKIFAFDIHNIKLMSNLRITNISPFPLINKILKMQPYDAIIFPDQGAYDRYKFDWGPNITPITAHKIRDQSSGLIKSYSIDIEGAVGDHHIKRALVVDDICDGGATFNILGQTLKSQYILADLYVSHGIFSRGLKELYKYYTSIYTTNSLDYFHTGERDPCLILDYDS